MTADKSDKVATALRATLISPNEFDTNGEAANVVDGLFAIARASGKPDYAENPDGFGSEWQ
jgi:hypothetical protein